MSWEISHCAVATYVQRHDNRDEATIALFMDPGGVNFAIAESPQSPCVTASGLRTMKSSSFLRAFSGMATVTGMLRTFWAKR